MNGNLNRQMMAYMLSFVYGQTLSLSFMSDQMDTMNLLSF